MIAFDTDVLTAILMGRAGFVERASRIAADQQSVPVIVIEEIMRGRLNVIRRAEAGSSKVAIDRAYELFEQSFSDRKDFRTRSRSKRRVLDLRSTRTWSRTRSSTLAGTRRHGSRSAGGATERSRSSSSRITASASSLNTTTRSSGSSSASTRRSRAPASGSPWSSASSRSTAGGSGSSRRARDAARLSASRCPVEKSSRP